MAAELLRPLQASEVTLFKIANRQGYAAICLSNLTEGKTPQEAFERMAKAVKRAGYELQGSIPKLKS